MSFSAVSPNTFDPYTVGYQMGVSLDDAVNAFSTSAEAVEDKVATSTDPVRNYEKLVTEILYGVADVVGAFTGRPKIQYPFFEKKQLVEPLIEPEESKTKNETETDSVQEFIREEIKNAMKKFQTPEIRPVQADSSTPSTVQESPTPIKVIPYKVGDRVGY